MNNKVYLAETANSSRNKVEKAVFSQIEEGISKKCF